MTTINSYDPGSLFDICVRMANKTIKNVKINVEHSLINRFRSSFNQSEYWFNYNLGAFYEEEDIEPLNINIESPEAAFNLLCDIASNHNVKNAVPEVSRDYDDIEDYSAALLADALKKDGVIVRDTSNIFDAEDIADAIVLHVEDADDVEDIMYGAEMTVDDMIRNGSTAIDDNNSGLFDNEVFVELYYRYV